ncbi:MAG TPA: UvrD-helicase domain-containing protein, partial [Anaeromyxobacteraceae bacterium]|nr:UvrD-helicase domain-containing protein [Anaeromyxobacteraceae bacterium]
LRALAGDVARLVRARAVRGERGEPPIAEGEPGLAEAARSRALAAAQALAASGAQASEAVAAALVEVRAEGPVEAGDLAALEALGRAARGGRPPAPIRALRDELLEGSAECVRAAADALGRPQRLALAALVAGAEERYRARKDAARSLDFDDLLSRARDLLRDDRALRDELRARLRALLVDEYQDVNGVQQELFDLLAGPAGGAPGPVLVAVGDAKQSIYRFRGADLGVFTRLLRRLGAGEGRVLHQSDNHRSTPAVVELVNAVFERILQPPDGEAARDDELRFEARDRLAAVRSGGGRPACELLLDGGEGDAGELRAREAAAIARRVKSILSGKAGVAVRERGRDGEPERARRPRPRDVALLLRRLTEVDAYERALRAEGVPFRVARGQGFYRAPEVRDLGELLAILVDPSDAAAWAAVLRSPWCAVPDGALYLLARGGLPALARDAPAEVRRRVEAEAGPGAMDEAAWGRLSALLEAVAALRPLRDRLPVHELLSRAVRGLDLDAVLVASPDGERRLANLQKALSLAARMHAEGGGALDLVRHLRAWAARPPREPEGDLDAEDAVAILSIHQAKGLEWPVVVVPDLGARLRQDGPRPMLDAAGRLCAPLCDPAADAVRTTRALEEARAAERRSASAESRRLLYVALTRARDHLVLSGETGRNGAETWRALLEPTLGDAGLVRRIDHAEAATARAGDPLPAVEAGPPSPPPPSRPPRLPGAARVESVRMAVTALAERFRCPRRHHFLHVLGIAEPRGAAGGPAGEDPGRATARGTLAHAMLAEADLAAGPLERRAQLAAAAARRGHDPQAPGVRRIAIEVARFLDSRAGREVADAARAGRLRREVPFLVRLPGDGDGVPATYLDGAIDALVVRAGEVRVIDYKYALPRRGSWERYRFQLAAYTLAAGRAFPRARVSATLVFLRGDHRQVDLTPDPESLAALARAAPRLAWEAFRGAGGPSTSLGTGDRPPEAPGRDAAGCRAEGCGFVARCWPAASPQRWPAASRPASHEVAHPA